MQIDRCVHGTINQHIGGWQSVTKLELKGILKHKSLGYSTKHIVQKKIFYVYDSMYSDLDRRRFAQFRGQSDIYNDKHSETSVRCCSSIITESHAGVPGTFLKMRNHLRQDLNLA